MVENGVDCYDVRTGEPRMKMKCLKKRWYQIVNPHTSGYLVNADKKRNVFVEYTKI